MLLRELTPVPGGYLILFFEDFRNFKKIASCGFAKPLKELAIFRQSTERTNSFKVIWLIHLKLKNHNNFIRISFLNFYNQSNEIKELSPEPATSNTHPTLVNEFGAISNTHQNTSSR